MLLNGYLSLLRASNGLDRLSKILRFRKSICKYIFMLSGGPLSHQSKLQSTIALSSTEAECIATTEAEKEALWILRFLNSLRFWLPNHSVDLCADNKGAISLTDDPESLRKTKHIEVRWQWIREKVERNEIVISYISTKEMLTDGFTKALGLKIFNDFRRMIGMTSAGQFCPSEIDRKEDKTSWKVIKSYRKS